MNSRPLFTLRLLGAPSILGPGGTPLGGQAAQRHRIALLALLARSPERGVSREKLLGYLWPESETEHARNRLNVSVYVLRKALGEDAILSEADRLRLNVQVIRVDVAEFEGALHDGDHERATASYEGPFLDGFFLDGTPEFDRWVERERDRLARSYAKALEDLAEAAETLGDPATAAGWWKERAAHDPYDSRVARRLMQTLEAAGNSAAALQHASIHERLLQDEFGVGPEAETRTLVEAIRQRRDLNEPRPVEPPRDHAPPPPELASVLEKGEAPAGAAEPAGRIARRVRPRIGRGRTLALSAAAVVVVSGLAALLLSISPQSGARSAGAAADGGVPDDRVASVSSRLPPERSIAVLPFVNLTPDPGEEYFSDGLAEELIGALARIRALRVAARTSSFAFKGKSGDVRGIGEALNVATVLEGSVRRDGERLIVTAQLIDVGDGFHLWSETYERRSTDIFDLQRDLALQIAGTLEAELTPGERAHLASQPTEHLEAYTSYLKGRHFWNQRTPSGYERAIDYFEQAIAIDSLYAAPHAGLAEVYAMRGLSGAIGTPEAVGRMKASALRAIELDDNSAEAHSALGLYLQVHERRADAAEREFQRSIELDPSYTQARHHYGNLLSALGRLEEAVAQKRAAVELDPLAPTLSETLAFTLLRAGRPDEALHYVSDALELDSTFWRAHAVLGLFHEVNDRFDDAIREYERANELAGSRVHRTKADIARVLALAGRRDAANRLVAELQAEAAATGIHEPSVATALMATGDEDAAFAWLEMAVQQKHLHLTFIAGDARFASFDNDPRFIALLRRLSLRR